MPRAEIVPFETEHLEGAARLLAARHARHRGAEPALPPCEDPVAAIEADRDPALAGAAALEHGEVVGYLVARRREEDAGALAWVGIAGCAARDAELTRDLYAAAAGGWLEAGLRRHMVFAPALDDLVDPWFRLSFGGSALLAARETAAATPVDAGVELRPGTPDDLEDAAAFDRGLRLHLSRSPSFSGLDVPGPIAFAGDWADTWSDERFVHFVAARGGRAVGHVLLYRRPADLRVPPGSIDLANCFTAPSVRGEGVGLALTAHALAWAHAQGIATVVTDWRLTNLEASRFWPARGFRTTFVRLYRAIP